ncbi:MAG: hypothetical protein NZ870_01455, partial [bacterium]|nr:hypothetical protein [bacterium]
LKKKLKVVIIGDIDKNDFSEFIDARGKLEMEVLIGLIKNSTIFIGADSGPLQIAKILLNKVVGIFGPSKPEEWAGEAVKVIRKNLPCVPCGLPKCKFGLVDCMKYIEVSDVINAIDR